ncbi:acyltransferase family protein [Mucilaginibacter angelicae]|uniref:Acyltransferase family protein n=1 Tax=Mucilaginibacter angelicae TaxID=869718 RepID=A0ABV6LAL2_9SPHI
MTLADSKTKPHIQQVDYIRAIASLAVALFHLGGKSLPGLRYGWLGVQMFFLLSGFIICWAIPENYSWALFPKYILKRISRIEPPYIASIVLTILAGYVLNANYRPDINNILTHFAYINNFTGRPYLSPVYWTLGVEFQYYLFIGLFFPVIIKKWGAIFLPVICLLPLFVSVPGSTLLNVFPFFALGILYYLYLTCKKGLIEVLIYGIAVTVIGIYTAGWMPMLAGLLAMALLTMPLRRYPVVSFFSKISFSLYLTHDVVGSSLVAFMGMHLPKTLAFKALEFLTGIVVSICFAYLFYRLVELPCLRLSKKIRY